MVWRTLVLFAAALASVAVPAAAQPPAGDRIVLPLPWAASPGWAAPAVPPIFDPTAVLPGQEPHPGQPPGWAGVPALDCGRRRLRFVSPLRGLFFRPSLTHRFRGGLRCGVPPGLRQPTFGRMP